MDRQVPLVDRRLRWLAVVVIAIAILLASVVRPGGVDGALGPFGIVGLDKWFHLLGYTSLALALAYALAEWESNVVAIGAFAGALSFGLGVELLQALIPYRGFSWLDLLANAIGPLIVAVLWSLLGDRVQYHDGEVDY